VPFRPQRGLRAIGHPEALEQVGQVRLDGLLGDPETTGQRPNRQDE
jgi:hypothetical protein